MPLEPIPLARILCTMLSILLPWGPTKGYIPWLPRTGIRRLKVLLTMVQSYLSVRLELRKNFKVLIVYRDQLVYKSQILQAALRTYS